MIRILLVLTIICISCNRSADQGKTVTLYSDTTGVQGKTITLYTDTTGVNIEATVPKDWIDYHALKFEIDDHLSFSSFGNSDTSQQLFVSVSRNIGKPNLKRLIEKALLERRALDSGVHLTDLKVIDSTVRYPVAFFDYYTQAFDTTFYSEDVVFITKGCIVNVSISTTKDEETFKYLKNLIRNSIKY